ncbi:MAG: transposase, partial [bacterium]
MLLQTFGETIRQIEGTFGGQVSADLCRKHGMSEGTFYAWKSKYSGMTVFE